MPGITHWLDDPSYRKPGNIHINRPRISAEAMLALVQLRNKLTGDNQSVYEASVRASEVDGL